MERSVLQPHASRESLQSKEVKSTNHQYPRQGTSWAINRSFSLNITSKVHLINSVTLLFSIYLETPE